MGGGATYFLPPAAGGTRKDGRDLVAGVRRRRLRRAADAPPTSKARLAGPPPKAMLGLFHPRHMSVAFDKVGAGRYSDELALERNQRPARSADAGRHDRRWRWRRWPPIRRAAST